MWAFKSVVIFISRSFSSLCNVKCFIDVALVLGSSRKQNKWGTCYYSPIPNAISRWCFALFQKSSLTRCFSKCNACMRSTHLYVTMVTHTPCVWSGGFVQPMYIHTDYGRILLKILVGEMAAQPIFRKGAVWWWWCKQGRSTTTVFVGWSVLAQSTQPSNHHLESTSPIPICGTYETRIEATTGREQWEWEKKNLLLMVHH